MAIEDFSDHNVQQMLQAVGGRLGSRSSQRPGGDPSGESGSQLGVTLDADAVESLGSDFGLDKPLSHRLLIDLVDEGYLDAEYHTTDSNVTPLRYAEVSGLTHKAREKLS